MDQRLHQALRALRGIRQRYELERSVDSGYVRSCGVHIALHPEDMLWIAATIEALEESGRRELEAFKNELETPSPA
jgi:hypothetical protein